MLKGNTCPSISCCMSNFNCIFCKYEFCYSAFETKENSREEKGASDKRLQIKHPMDDKNH